MLYMVMHHSNVPINKSLWVTIRKRFHPRSTSVDCISSDVSGGSKFNGVVEESIGFITVK